VGVCVFVSGVLSFSRIAYQWLPSMGSYQTLAPSTPAQTKD